MKANLHFTCVAFSLLLWIASSLCNAQVRINEVLATNRMAFNNGGDFPDYVELYNTNFTDANISGWRLTDDLNRRPFVFRTGTIVPARSYLIIFCDMNTSAPGLHTGFDLDGKGDAVYLLSPVGVLRDRVIFGFQCPDKSIGRFPDGAGLFQLGTPTPGATNNSVPLGNPSSLRINEWMALTQIPDAPDDDWFELYNADSEIVNISACVWTDQNHVPVTNHAMRDLSFIMPGSFIRFFANDSDPAIWPDQVDFQLSSTFGDRIVLFESNRTAEIVRVQFPPQSLNISQGYLPDGNTNNIVYFPEGRATPGESNWLPIENVRINEVLTNPEQSQGDAIELYNPGEFSVDISGWFLSDSTEQLQKFRIPSFTQLPPFGFAVFYESPGSPFGFNSNGLAISPSFSLDSARGGRVILSSVNRQGQLNGYRRIVRFDAAPKGVSFGRYFTSIGEADFVSMKRLTLGTHNSEPRISPIVITEIMYHPPDVIAGTEYIDNTFDEYIELYNRSGSEVRLFDTNTYSYYPDAWRNTWRIDGDARFQFPTNVVLLPGKSLLIVSFPVTNTFPVNVFRGKYRVPPATPIFGPYQGILANGDGNVELFAPDAPQPPGQPDEGFVPYVPIEKVKYYDNDLRSHWPPETDGFGFSLARRIPEHYGNDIANWRAERPSPGRQRIELEPIYISEDAVAIRFLGWAGSSYSVLHSSNLVHWTKLTDFPFQPTSGPRHVADPILAAATSFYRVVTPMQP
jgi:hypothetical protein